MLQHGSAFEMLLFCASLILFLIKKIKQILRCNDVGDKTRPASALQKLQNNAIKVSK